MFFWGQGFGCSYLEFSSKNNFSIKARKGFVVYTLVSWAHLCRLPNFIPKPLREVRTIHGSESK